ncbi:MAG: 6-bladed beta-propeller [Candidatus Krumholzibacteriia bacterium]
MRSPTRLAAVLLFAALAAPSLSSPAAADWKGKQVAQGDVVLVQNPAEPMLAPTTIRPTEAWRLGGDSDSDDEFFGVLVDMLEDPEGDVYLLDQVLCDIKVFSHDGEFLRAIGREGEGPGEFRNARDFVQLPDGTLAVFELAPGRVVQLTPDGVPAGEHPLPTIEGAGFLILLGAQREADNLALAFGYNSFETGKFTTVRCLSRIGADGALLTDYVKDPRSVDLANPVIEERRWDGFENRWAMGVDGRVYAAVHWGEYEITVWTADGRRERVITRPLEERKRSREEMDRYHAIYEPFIRSFPGAKPGIEDRDHRIQQVHIRPDGSLWVLNAFGAFERPEGSLGVFDVFDAQGRFQREVTIMGEGDPLRDGYRFIGDRLYVMTGFLDAAMNAAGGADDEAMAEDAKPMAVICYELGDALKLARADR